MRTSDNIIRPGTYFIQKAVDRGLQAISARLDPSEDGRPFFWLNLSPEPRLEHSIWDFGDMCSRYVDAYILGRQVTGNTDHIGAEKSLRQMLTKSDPYAHPFMATRVLIAYVDKYLQDPSWKKEVDNLVKLIRSRMTFEDDYAYYFRQHDGWKSINQSLGDFSPYPTYPIGGIILALSRYLESADSPESEDLINRLCKFVINISGVFEKDGSYKGHTHSGGVLTSVAGILRWSIHTGDTHTVGLMKNAFDWTVKHSSSWGWVPDGLGQEPGSGETCSLTDALHIAVLIGRYIDSSYFGIAERYSRNQLMENQFTRPEKAIPEGDFAHRDIVAKALYGSWASWSFPNSLDNCLKGVEGCCLGAGIRGCFLVWDSAIERKNNAVYVNMAFSRNSPWLEVISYQPYDGRLDLLVHEDTPEILVRMPGWANISNIKVNKDEAQVPVELSDNHYLHLHKLRENSLVKIEYPLHRRSITEIVSGIEYEVRWLGDTVAEINPRGNTYPIYERDWIEPDLATQMADHWYELQKGGPVYW